MSTPPPLPLSGSDADQPGDALAVWLLAVGQTLGYASLYYSFGALLVAVGDETGWSKGQMALGLTLSLICAALSSPLTGRLVDRGRGVELLAGGAILGGLCLLTIAQARSLWQWYLAWIIVGPAMAASLYETCFAFLTRRLGSAARPAIIRVTLVAGLASTLAFPLGASLSSLAGWRWAFSAFAGLELLVAAPVMIYAGIRLRRRERAGAAPPPQSRDALRRALGQARFWLLALGFGLAWMNHSMLVTYFIPLFTGLGVSASLAVAAAATVGPFQVVGRITLMLLDARAPALLATRTGFAMQAAAALILLMAGAAPMLVFLFAVAQGSAIGILSILRPVLIAEVMGRDGFGAISGAIAMGPLLANAAAPVTGAFLLGLGGPVALVFGALAMAAVGLGLMLMVRSRAA
ncbi:MFS transporter [Frigidibacter sp. ROC022]|uniref:MFS transporter n=1 Tax=Frigidibacter sp. ROC022 TaxID=2971796 RepID=UPI00215A50EC|nr:MFS transporter [Frigidibacter sp. ROC022]MCR8726345.1 MFS transporter [Frigidibacter sp. ROC022]